MKDYKKGLVTAGITTISVGITSTVTATVTILKKLSNFSSIATIIAVALTTTLAVTFFTSLIIDKISSRGQEGITKAPIAKVGEQSKDCDINNDNCEKSDQECAPLSRKEHNHED